MSAVNAMKINNYQRPVNLLDIAGNNQAKSVGADNSFKAALSQEMVQSQPVAFSKHASERLHSRGIVLTNDQMQKIGNAVDKADAKGSRETLILTDDAALVVAVKNRTVITAFDRDHLRSGVVTSIDSAVII